MTLKRKGALVAGSLVAVFAFVAAGCGGDDGGGSAPEALPSSSCTAIEYEGDGNPDYILASDFPLQGSSRTQTEQIVEAIAPQGKFGLIDDPATLDIMKFKRKSVSVHWELMFTRSLFQTADMEAQHHLLNALAGLVDAGVVAVIGHLNSGVSIETAPIYAAKSIPQIAISTNPNSGSGSRS